MPPASGGRLSCPKFGRTKAAQYGLVSLRPSPHRRPVQTGHASTPDRSWATMAQKLAPVGILPPHAFRVTGGGMRRLLGLAVLCAIAHSVAATPAGTIRDAEHGFSFTVPDGPSFTQLKIQQMRGADLGRPERR